MSPQLNFDLYIFSSTSRNYSNWDRIMQNLVRQGRGSFWALRWGSNPPTLALYEGMSRSGKVPQYWPHSEFLGKRSIFFLYSCLNSFWKILDQCWCKLRIINIFYEEKNPWEFHYKSKIIHSDIRTICSWEMIFRLPGFRKWTAVIWQKQNSWYGLKKKKADVNEEMCHRVLEGWWSWEVWNGYKH